MQFFGLLMSCPALEDVVMPELMLQKSETIAFVSLRALVSVLPIAKILNLGTNRHLHLLTRFCRCDCNLGNTGDEGDTKRAIRWCRVYCLSSQGLWSRGLGFNSQGLATELAGFGLPSNHPVQ